MTTASLVAFWRKPVYSLNACGEMKYMDVYRQCLLCNRETLEFIDRGYGLMKTAVNDVKLLSPSN